MTYSSLQQHVIGLIACCCLAIMGSGCTKDVNWKTPDLAWEKPSPQGAGIYPIYCNGAVLLSSYTDGQLCIEKISLKNGRHQWQWCDSEKVIPNLYYNLQPYLGKKVLIIPAKNHTVAIDVKSGREKWRHQLFDAAEAHLEACGNKALRTFYDQKNKMARVVAFERQSGNYQQLFEYPLSDSAKTFLRTPVPIVSKQDTSYLSALLVYTFQKQTTENAILSWRTSKPDTFSKAPIYPDNTNGYGISKQAIVDEGSTYWIASNEIIRWEAEKEEVVWRTDLPRDMLTSRPKLIDQSIYYAGEDGVLYAVNTADGKLQWSTKISGTPSRVFYHKDVLAVVGGGDGLLYLINATNGQLIDKKTAHGHQLSSGIHFQRPMYLGQDHLLVNDSKRWLCYKL
ncbi:MAG: PQQ-binding-like beta-propeller repeat protein [Bacteroidota bacterium]